MSEKFDPTSQRNPGLSPQQDIPAIRVGIFQSSTIKFVLDGAFSCNDKSGIVTGPCSATLSEGKVALQINGVDVCSSSELFLSPCEVSSSFVLNDVVIGIDFHWERKEDQRFTGALRLIPSGDRVYAVNVVSIEDYLTSVISSEMSAGSSLHLLKAHAVTSRSWLLAQLEKSRRLKSGASSYQSLVETSAERIRWYDREDHELFDVCADDHCQRYQGITKAFTPAVQDAVQSTAGTVVKYQGHICDARFSKSCGGIVEEFQNVWEPVRYPYLTCVVDSRAGGTPPDFSDEKNAEQWIRSTPEVYCNTTDKRILSQVLLKYDQETADFFRWQVEYTQEKLADIIRRRSGIDFGAIVDLIPVERGVSGRLTKLKVVGTKKSLTIGKELEIRRTLSNSHLYSSALVIDALNRSNGIPAKFVLHGAGWGHGVGLCQIGAAVMGERGIPYEGILSHYFPNTTLEKIY